MKTVKTKIDKTSSAIDDLQSFTVYFNNYGYD